MARSHCLCMRGWRAERLIRAAFAAIILGLVLVFVASPVFGQKKYSPNDPFVEDLVRRGIKYYEENRPRAEDDVMLAALAVIETYKRYENYVPTDHPIVASAVRDILAQVSQQQGGGRTNLVMVGSYMPALAAIILCECNDQAYAEQVKFILDILAARQNQQGGFGYTYEPEVTDTSQGQYVGLAFIVAKNHGIMMDPKISSRLLDAYCDTQIEDTWIYHYKNGRPDGIDVGKRSSLHIAGLSTTYLLADLLRLRTKPRRTAIANTTKFQGELPPSVVLYVKPKVGEAEDPADLNKPLVTYDTARLNNIQAGGIRWLNENYAVFPTRWPYYYMYGFERYAFFREKMEGVYDDVPTWYDDGVEHLAATQLPSGGWENQVGAGEENPSQATGLAILFLVRSSQILMVESAGGTVVGNLGFEENVRLDMKGGEVTGNELGKGIDDVVNLVNQADSQNQLERILPVLSKAIKELSNDSTKSRGEKMSFLRGLVMHEDNLRRMVAVRILAGQQDLDNVPALLFALTDPDLEVCREAHNGLRLVSRKIDAYPLSAEPTAQEYLDLKKKWTEWFLRVRPDAVLLD